MPVQTLFLDQVRTASDIYYQWSEDGALLLTLECRPGSGRCLTYRELRAHLRAMCPWQLKQNVIIGLTDELAEVYTLYHEFERAGGTSSSSLMLVSTPPEEYFEALAA